MSEQLDLDALELRHAPVGSMCQWCAEAAPCDVALCVAEVRELRKENLALCELARDCPAHPRIVAQMQELTATVMELRLAMAQLDPQRQQRGRA